MTTSRRKQLKGGFLNSSVTRDGGVIERSAGPWSPAVHAWLRHLEASGRDLAPKPIELDLTRGTETLSFVDGKVLSGGSSPRYLWREKTLVRMAQLIRCFHDLAKSFVPPPGAYWQDTLACPGGGDVICHNDIAPWNTVFKREAPTALIDWDLAAPGPRIWDVAYAAWHVVPLYGDPSSDPFDTAVFEPRATRTRLFCDAYGRDNTRNIIDAIIQRQLSACAAIERGAQNGDPAYRRLLELGAVNGIKRQMAYVRANRTELERALA